MMIFDVCGGRDRVKICERIEYCLLIKLCILLFERCDL